MIVESLLAKIATIILKKAAVGSFLKGVVTGVKIYTVFDAIDGIIDCVNTTSDCRDLSVCGIQVMSEQLTQVAAEKLLAYGSATYEVQKTTSGLYVASNIVPRFALDGDHFPEFGARKFPEYKPRQLRKLEFPRMRNGKSQND